MQISYSRTKNKANFTIIQESRFEITDNNGLYLKISKHTLKFQSSIFPEIPQDYTAKNYNSNMQKQIRNVPFKNQEPQSSEKQSKKQSEKGTQQDRTHQLEQEQTIP